MNRISKNRLLVLSAVMVGLVCLAFLSEVVSFVREHSWAPTPSGVTRTNFDHIEDGMTEDQVEQLLGGPPGNYTNRPDTQGQTGISFRRFWYGDEGNIIVELSFPDKSDEPRRVENKRFVHAR